jgi:hypothetical protein
MPGACTFCGAPSTKPTRIRCCSFSARASLASAFLHLKATLGAPIRLAPDMLNLGKTVPPPLKVLTCSLDWIKRHHRHHRPTGSSHRSDG